MTPILMALALLRAQGDLIPLYDFDRRHWWFDGLAELIIQLPTEDQRTAWVALVANDLCHRVPGLPLSVAAGPLLDRMKVLERRP